MGKAVGNDVALSLFLQTVVADGFGGKHGFLNVFGFEDIVVDGVVSPNTGETVGLQFEFDGKGIGLFFADLLLHFVDFRQNAEQVLNVMADFMGNNVGKRGIAGGFELGAHVFVETQIQINFLVAWAVKWTHGRLACTAGGGRTAFIQHHGCRCVALAVLLEIFAPCFFRIGKDDAGQLVQLGFLLAVESGSLLGRNAHRR